MTTTFHNWEQEIPKIQKVRKAISKYSSRVSDILNSPGANCYQSNIALQDFVSEITKIADSSVHLSLVKEVKDAS